MDQQEFLNITRQTMRVLYLFYGKTLQQLFQFTSLAQFQTYLLRFYNYFLVVVWMSIDPYQSIKNKIKLPPKHNVLKDMKLFPQLKSQKGQKGYQLPQPLLNKTNILIEELNKSFEVYSNQTNYRFHFPESLFPDVPTGQQNQITYEQKMISEEENTFKNKLSEEQLQEISEKGEFKVKSNIEYVTLPYVWKINETLFWGKQKVLLVWHNSLAKIFGFFSTAKSQLFTFIPKQLNKIKQIPSTIFSIIFGKRSLQTVVSVNYENQLFMDFWKKIIDNYYIESDEWASALWNYLYVYYDPQLERPIKHNLNEKINVKNRQARRLLQQQQQQKARQSTSKGYKIENVHNKFNQEWNKLKKKVILQVSDEINNINASTYSKPESEQELLVHSESSNDDKVLELLSEKKFSLYIEHMKTELPKENIPLDVINAIVIILRLFRVIQSKYDTKKKLLDKKKKEIQESIKKRHPIKSIHQPFFISKVQKEFKIISDALNEQMYQNLLRDKEFSSLLNEKQKQAYREFINLRSNYHALENAKKNQLRELHSPSRTFYSNYHLLPPYQIIKANGNYSLKTISDDLKVDTNTDFWKLKLYWMRIKTWSINCLIFLSFVAWNGPTGLRCLYGVKDFGYEMDINYQTGEIYYHERKTVIGTFLKVVQGMRKSRAQFENLPDLGILGKNISRYFNYAQCYIFRFLFAGILITLIGYPIIIVLFSVISTVLVITFWAWMPIILMTTYIFNIFVYQFQSAFILNGFTSRSFPIISIVYQLIRFLVITLLLVLNLTLLVPLKSLFILSFCFFQKYFRTIFDKILLFLFRKVGRTPSRDTSIAKKISGPGMSKQFYMSINEQDVYVLVRSQLEKQFMQQFDSLLQMQMYENMKKAADILNSILSPFDVIFPGVNYVTQNSQSLMENYRTQYYQYMARYPQNPSRVRFTQQQIDSYFDNTIEIVRNFVTKYEIEKWIFEKFELYEGMYDELTRGIWMQIFQCGQEIFEPLEKLDARFKLQDQYNDEDGFNESMKHNVNNIMKSLEGEVKLSHHRQKVAPFKHNLLHREQKTEQITEVLSLLSRNSLKTVNLNRESVQTLFIPNLNINDIITISKEQRQREIQNHPDIIDL